MSVGYLTISKGTNETPEVPTHGSNGPGNIVR